LFIGHQLVHWLSFSLADVEVLEGIDHRCLLLETQVLILIFESVIEDEDLTLALDLLSGDVFQTLRS
jgi:hypothetical protein